MVAKNDLTPASLSYIISGVKILVGRISSFWQEVSEAPTLIDIAIINLCILFMCQ